MKLNLASWSTPETQKNAGLMSTVLPSETLGQSWGENCNHLNRNMATSLGYDWLEDIDQESSQSFSCSSLAAQLSGKRVQANHLHHHTTQQPHQTTWAPSSRPGSSFAFNDHSIQQTAASIETIEDQFLPVGQDQDAVDFGPGEVIFGRCFSHDIPDLMFALDEIEPQLSNLELGPQPSQVQVGTQGIPELFEQESPCNQDFGFSQSQASPSIRFNPYSRERANHVRQLCSMSAVHTASPNTLTETKQAGREMVFNPKTGEQHKPVSKRQHRITTKAQSLNRRLIRRRGGQCESCRRRKRKVCWILFTSDLSSSDMQIVRSFSSNFRISRGY